MSSQTSCSWLADLVILYTYYVWLCWNNKKKKNRENSVAKSNKLTQKTLVTFLKILSMKARQVQYYKKILFGKCRGKQIFWILTFEIVNDIYFYLWIWSSSELKIMQNTIFFYEKKVVRAVTKYVEVMVGYE
jgi:hypothetical protein